MGNFTYFVNLTKKEFTFGPYSNEQFSDLEELFNLLKYSSWTIMDNIVFINEIFDTTEPILAPYNPKEFICIRFEEDGCITIDEETKLPE